MVFVFIYIYWCPTRFCHIRWCSSRLTVIRRVSLVDYILYCNFWPLYCLLFFWFLLGYLQTMRAYRTNLTPPHLNKVPAQREESEWSCIYMLGESISLFSTIFLLDFGTVPTVWYFLFFIFSISFHISTYFSSILSKSYHYLTFLSSIFFISLHNFLPYFPYLFTIQLTFHPYVPYLFSLFLMILSNQNCLLFMFADFPRLILLC